jgi:hypothetical protein
MRGRVGSSKGVRAAERANGVQRDARGMPFSLAKE